MSDTAERIHAALSSAEDRSCGSDELAAAASPGWDECHLGRGGANVIRPLGVGAGERVLVLGAGSGVLVRYAADVGAEVVGIEADQQWLGAARARVEGCQGVTLQDTPPRDADGAFDVVIIAASPESSPLPVIDAMLVEAAARLADDGVVAVAVPNSVSVAQLAGFRLPDLDGVSTGSSAADLADIFEAAGLAVGVTLACYPDVFSSTTILAPEAFMGDGAAAFVDQLVGAPASGALGRPFVLADDRAVLRAAVDAGAGLATAPGLLMIGARTTDEVTARLGPSALAWRFTGGRRKTLQQQLVVRSAEHGLTASRSMLHDPAEGPSLQWLTHTVAPEQPYVIGENLEQRALDALAHADTSELTEVLGLWLGELAAVVIERPDVPPHPFLPEEAVAVLPPDHLDAGLDNFTVGPAGVVFVDREWRAAGGVEFGLAVTRALWKVAVNTVRNGSRHPWSPAATVAEVWMELARDTPLDLSEVSLERWWPAEAELLAIVTGAEPAVTIDELRALASRSRVERAVYPAGVEATQALRDLDLQVARLGEQLGSAHRRIADLEEDRAALAERIEELRGMLPVRAGRQVKRLLGR